ncbi:TetR/AcrR family transcriptional regulator [Arthrobacter sp. 35W]|uniref:TetR/AcrR family transcriptional regulator n=1 Tax=Arthrobacter sp. 35W TaxID=1132441 RepID=UPI00047E4E18|nr:TetR family transcriptional regulator [Arthrobacter sp. 35W]
MTESANIDGGYGLRERKRAATRAAISATARRLTARSGLNGFTIEALCEEVGISRRTFFNYFPSKEDAIIGHMLDDFPDEELQAFLDGADTSGPGVLSRNLLQDLFEVTCAVVEHGDFNKDEIAELVAVIKVEPQLLLKMMGTAGDREAEFAALIAQREGLPPGHPAAVMVTMLFGVVSRKTGEEFFSEANTLSYRAILGGYLAAAQDFFSLPFTPTEGTP